MATATNDKPVRLGDLPVIKTNILENARQYDKGIIGGYNGTFPLTAATKGNIYLLPATNKFYMCITNYNGSNLTAPNANFEELSVWANRDKLENLNRIVQKTYYSNVSKELDAIFYLYKIGKNVFCNAIVKAKPNYTYDIEIDKEFRPITNELSITGQHLQDANIRTVNIRIKNGIPFTDYAYSGGIYLISTMWNTN